LDWTEEFSIDPEIFDDVYMEAATRALEKRKDGEKFLVTVVMECYLKKDMKDANKHYVYNTYFVLINAGLHYKAEMMRLNFLKSHGIDLRKENLKGDDTPELSSEQKQIEDQLGETKKHLKKNNKDNGTEPTNNSEGESKSTEPNDPPASPS